MGQGGEIKAYRGDPLANPHFPFELGGTDKLTEMERKTGATTERESYPASTTSHSSEFTGWGITVEEEGECLPYSL